MAAKDQIHTAVKNALVKDGWKITADPYTLWYGGKKVEIDLAAEKLLAAERDGEQIAVRNQEFHRTVAHPRFGSGTRSV